MTIFTHNTLTVVKVVLAMSVLGVLSTPLMAQASGGINVIFEAEPLFSETSVLPGDYVTRSVTVTNNDAETRAVYFDLQNGSQSQGLGDVLELNISVNGVTRLSTTSLTTLLATGEQKIEDSLVSGATIVFDVAIALPEDAGNVYQSGTARFNACFGIDGGTYGCDSGSTGGNPSTGGSNPSGGGPLLNGNDDDDESDSNDTEPTGDVGGGVELRIFTVGSQNVTQSGTSDIFWQTNLEATSQVVYGPVSDAPVFDPADAHFGYPFRTETFDNDTRTHQVFLSNLEAGTTYVYRVVSRRSVDSEPTVSDVHYFSVPVNQFVPTGVGGFSEGNAFGGAPRAQASEASSDEAVTGHPEAASDGTRAEDTEMTAGAAADFSQMAAAILALPEWLGTCGNCIWVTGLVVALTLLYTTWWERELLTRPQPYPRNYRRLWVVALLGMVSIPVLILLGYTCGLILLLAASGGLLISALVDQRLVKGLTPKERLVRVCALLIVMQVLGLLVALFMSNWCSLIVSIMIILLLMLRISVVYGLER